LVGYYCTDDDDSNYDKDRGGDDDNNNITSISSVPCAKLFVFFAVGGDGSLFIHAHLHHSLISWNCHWQASDHW
jgi:hypothetical protein